MTPKAVNGMDDRWHRVESPVGPLLLASDGTGLSGVFFDDHRDGADGRADHVAQGTPVPEDPVLHLAAAQIQEYFAGARHAFDIPLAPIGTPFQHRVWKALRTIPYGQVATYGDIARQLTLAPSASRAVGMANAANPLSIVVPCHRVVGADGSLTGYGGGVHRKQFLLDHERDRLF